MKPITLELLQLLLEDLIEKGHLLVKPHGRWLAEGKKTAILKKRKFDLSQPLWLISEGKAWGVFRCWPPKQLSLATLLKPDFRKRHLVSREEIREWWGEVNKLYYYELRDFIPFKPFPVIVPRGVQGPIRRVIRKAEVDPYLVYPPQDQPVPYILQRHQRGKSSHVDLRIAKTKYWGVGYTLLDQIPGKIPRPITTLKELEKFIWRDIWKIDWKRGVIRPRRIKGEIVRRAQIRVILKKVKIGKAWWRAHGVTEQPDPFEAPIPPGATRRYPGVFYIFDKGTAVWGALKPYYHEFFLFDGKSLKGRFFARAIGVTEKGLLVLPELEKQEIILPPGVVPEVERQPYFWTLIQPDDQTPYCLSERAVEKEWLPPRGIAALPPKVKRAIPKRLRYWEHPRKKALALRKELVETWDIRELIEPIVEV